MRFIWNRLSFCFVFAIDQSRQAEALQKRFPLATQLKERGDAYQVQLSALRGYLLQHDQVELDKFNEMSKLLEDKKDELLSYPNLSQSVKIQWNQDPLGENSLKRKFSLLQKNKSGKRPCK